MKRADYIVFVLGLCLILTAFAVKNTKKNLIVSFKNLPATTKIIRLAIYRKTDKFPLKGKYFKIYTIATDAKTNLSYEIADLEYGEYAAMFFQQFDKSVAEVSEESTGFSQHYRPQAGIPEFEDCKFEYSEKENTIILSE
jgi:uncharacterized protein (DUF2141 family)